MHINDLPTLVVRQILVRTTSPSVLSMEDWAGCLGPMSVCRSWRSETVPLLYTNAIIDYTTTDGSVPQRASSNIQLILENHYPDLVKALVVHVPYFVDGDFAVNILFFLLPSELDRILHLPGYSLGYWTLPMDVPMSLGGVGIEPLLLIMPNLKYFFIQNIMRPRIGVSDASLLTGYIISREYRADPVLQNTCPNMDVITSCGTAVVSVSAHDLLMERSNDNPVCFSAEYIRRLGILALPENLLLRVENIDEVCNRVRTMITPYERKLEPWMLARYRTVFYIPNIVFRGQRGINRRFHLYVFDRSVDFEVGNMVDVQDSSDFTSESDNNQTADPTHEA